MYNIIINIVKKGVMGDISPLVLFDRPWLHLKLDTAPPLQRRFQRGHNYNILYGNSILQKKKKAV